MYLHQTFRSASNKDCACRTSWDRNLTKCVPNISLLSTDFALPRVHACRLNTIVCTSGEPCCPHEYSKVAKVSETRSPFLDTCKYFESVRSAGSGCPNRCRCREKYYLSEYPFVLAVLCAIGNASQKYIFRLDIEEFTDDELTHRSSKDFETHWNDWILSRDLSWAGNLIAVTWAFRRVEGTQYTHHCGGLVMRF